jgi:hypothetical protein
MTISPQEYEFVNTVAETFNIPAEEFALTEVLY